MYSMENSLATEQQGIELLYRGESITNVPFQDVEQFNKFAEELDLPSITDVANWSKDFNIPQHYKDLDVEKFVYSKLEQGDPDQIGLSLIHI